ncbi:hypothetical protein [Azospirillum largimobile]
MAGGPPVCDWMNRGPVTDEAWMRPLCRDRLSQRCDRATRGRKLRMADTGPALAPILFPLRLATVPPPAAPCSRHLGY